MSSKPKTQEESKMSGVMVLGLGLAVFLAIMAVVAFFINMNTPLASISFTPTPSSTLVPTPMGAPTNSIPPTKTPLPQTYTVQAGDTWASIAYMYGLTMDELKALNGGERSGNLMGGQLLVISTTGEIPEITDTSKIYLVRNGDTCTSIANTAGLGLNELVRINELNNLCMIYVGQKLVIDLAALPKE
jgi:LysM repeat protein